LKHRCRQMEVVALIPAIDAAITLVERAPTA
jgi:hypothetical protein